MVNFFHVGVGGNLVAVQASRLATYLHMKVGLGVLPDNTKYGCITTFCTGGKRSGSLYQNVLL